MQPKLSFDYNSQAGNGLVGMGWSIGGLSVIHRCGATIAIDGFNGGVNYDANDRFCLDGERLTSVGGNQYRTQHETWQRVVASDSTTNPASFTVTAKDGTVMTYGATADSQILAQGKSVVRVWALNKIQDTSGNYLTISYQNNGYSTGEYYPLSIAYTGNGGVVPYNFVYFDYTSRPDSFQVYEGGSPISMTKLLSDIRTCTDSSCGQGSSLVRKYVLAYDNNGAVGRSRLDSIQECGTDGVCLPATTFGWTNAASGFTTSTWPVSNNWASPGYTWVADFNGDGKADIATALGGNVYVRLSTGSGSAAVNVVVASI